jgi:hypothetical protein
MENQSDKTMYIRCYNCESHGSRGENALKAIANWNKVAIK